MKSKICFLNLDTGLQKGMDELLPLLQLEICKDGVPVRVLCDEMLTLKKDADEIVLSYSQPYEFYRALSMLDRFIKNDASEYRARSSFDMLCYMADMSRNAVFNLKTAKEMIRLLALCGYNALMLYTEDTYEIPEYPYFGHMRGRFSKEELQCIDDYATQFGIEVIPCIQTLAHLESALQWDAFARVRDTQDILLVGEEKTYDLIEHMIRTCRSCFRSKRINVGLDEALMLGRGKYMDRNGSCLKSDIMKTHLARVNALCEAYGFQMMMWSDMFFRAAYHGWYHECTELLPEYVLDLVPENAVPIYWDYATADRAHFEHMVNCHLQFRNPVAFAGGVGKWHGFAPANAVSVAISEVQLDVCREKGIRNVIATAWGDGGAEASQFSALATVLYYAERRYDDRPEEAWMEARAMECFGIGYRDLLATDLPNEMGERYFEKTKVTNPSKYLLYNDPLNGLMDANMDAESVSAAFRKNAEALRPLTSHPTWGYMFRMLYCLCDVLVLKADLSVRIRKAYRAKQNGVLEEIAKQEIPEIVTKLDRFIEAFRTQWMRENKAFGFDIQAERLGGLRLRLFLAAERISEYLDGKLSQIDELEEEQLPLRDTGCDNPYFKLWNEAAAISANKRL